MVPLSKIVPSRGSFPLLFVPDSGAFPFTPWSKKALPLCGTTTIKTFGVCRRYILYCYCNSSRYVYIPYLSFFSLTTAGNQVWFDLLYSVSLFWFTMLPRARKVGMNVIPWCLYVCATASIGGLHMYSRILYLEEQQKDQGYTTFE